MNKLIAILFALTCFSTSALSSSMMGAGMWFWIIIGIGIFVAISQFYPMLRGAGAGLAMLLAGISTLAILLGCSQLQSAVHLRWMAVRQAYFFYFSLSQC